MLLNKLRKSKFYYVVENVIITIDYINELAYCRTFIRIQNSITKILILRSQKSPINIFKFNVNSIIVYF